jgi:hypothetical protein
VEWSGGVETEGGKSGAVREGLTLLCPPASQPLSLRGEEGGEGLLFFCFFGGLLTERRRERRERRAEKPKNRKTEKQMTRGWGNGKKQQRMDTRERERAPLFVKENDRLEEKKERTAFSFVDGGWG